VYGNGDVEITPGLKWSSTAATVTFECPKHGVATIALEELSSGRRAPRGKPRSIEIDFSRY